MKFIVKNYLNCERCPLHEFRRNIVFGRGKIPAKIFFVGEAPGKTEDLLGVPFIGPSGKLLDKAFELACQMAGVSEPPTYFISNVVGCRPTDSKDGENRQPTGEEAWACWERLEKTHAAVKPQKVIFLGKVALVQCRKAWPEALALPHPAYLLRLGGVESPAFRAFARDLSAVFKELSNAQKD